MNKIEKMADDFRRWGKVRTRRVLRGVQKWGVMFDWWYDLDTKKG